MAQPVLARPDEEGSHWHLDHQPGGQPLLQGLIQRKRFLCAHEPAWEQRGPRDREIASLNRQIDSLLDHWRLRRLPKASASALQSPAVDSRPIAGTTALRKETT